MSNTELFIDETGDNFIESELSRPINGCRVTVEEDRDPQRKDDDDDDKREGLGESEMIVVSSKEEELINMPSLGELDADKENDGFRTPTSIDHKIPFSKKCPLAPRKPKSCPMKKKRKASSSSNVIRYRINLSKELEAMFPTLNSSDLAHKIKSSQG